MKKILLIKTGIAGLAAVSILGAAILPSDSASASSLNAASCTITASDSGKNVPGLGSILPYGLDDPDEAAKLLASPCKNYVLKGSMDEIRNAIISIYMTLSGDFNNNGKADDGTSPIDPIWAADFKAALAKAETVRLEPTEEWADITTDDLKYINFITGYLGINTPDFIVDLTAKNINITKADLSVIEYKVRTVTASGKIIVVNKDQLDQLNDLADTVIAHGGIYDAQGNVLVAPDTGEGSSFLPLTAVIAALVSIAGVGAVALSLGLAGRQ